MSEILAGRKVLAYDVLVGIARGLRIPRELMGLSYGQASADNEDDAYPGAETDDGLTGRWKRRCDDALSSPLPRSLLSVGS